MQTPTQQYREDLSQFLGLKGTIKNYTVLSHPNPEANHSGGAAIVQLENGQLKTLSIHSEDLERIQIGSKIKIQLRLVHTAPNGLKTYGLAAKLT